MPRYTATATFSPDIAVQADDLIQNAGAYMVFVCPSTMVGDDHAVEIPPGKGIRIKNAAAIRVRSASARPSAIKIIRGL